MTVKIQDVTLTLFAWDDIPATSYGAHTGRFSGESRLGLLSIETDQGPAIGVICVFKPKMRLGTSSISLG